ncbi:MAG: glycosyltransferase, partial [Actinophytocola sp.]|nr:glycosyltransferase [Actinophytocola sp.]
MPVVILPVLNEAEALPTLLPALPAGWEALVVDNGSTDGSGQLAASLGARVVVEARRGFGAACWAGLEAARPRDGVVAFMDADGSFDPADLARVARPVLEGRTDLSLGARRPTVWGSFPLHARLGNRVVVGEL